jgi:hypothetical protein
MSLCVIGYSEVQANQENQFNSHLYVYAEAGFTHRAIMNDVVVLLRSC